MLRLGRAGPTLGPMAPEAGGNLPTPLTRFVGRESSLTEVSALLAANRLVTLVGSGGSGKTRLALEVARRLSAEHRDGIRIVDLSGLSDPTLVPVAVASAVGLRDLDGGKPADAVAGFLADRAVLLLLDNCEHLVESCAALAADLLERCPSLTLLATSREPLGVPGEVLVRVTGLTVPDAGAADDLASIADAESVRLFADRAAASRPEFRLDDSNCGAVAEICRRLDGIPLALELAAARVGMMSLQAIVDGLSDRFHLLVGSRGRPPRQRTLRSSLDWSHALLGNAERALFRRLAVFPSSFTVAGVEAVCAGGAVDRGEVFGLLTNLFDRSLIQVDEGGDRYRLLQTIRAYAAEALDVAREARATRDKHLAFVASLAATVEPALWSGGLAAVLPTLRAELPGIRAALEWSLESAAVDVGAAALVSLGNFFYVAGLRTEAWSRCEQFLGRVHDQRCRADLLYWAANFAWYSDPSVTLRYGSELAAIGKETGDLGLVARGLGQVGAVQMTLQPELALDTLDQAVLSARTAGLETAAVDALCFKTIAYQSLGRLADAVRCGQDAIAAAEAIDWVWAATFARSLTASIAVMTGQLDWADATANRVRRFGEELADPLFIAAAETVRARVGMYRGDPAAGAALERARAAAESCGDVVNLAAIRSYHGQLLLSHGMIDDGTRVLGEATVETDVHLPATSLINRAHLAEAAIATGDLDTARLHVEACAASGAGAESPLSAWNLRAAARLARARGDSLRARGLCCEGLGRAFDAGALLLVTDLLEVTALSCFDLDLHLEAARLLGAAESQRDKAGYVRPPSLQVEVDRLVAGLEARMGNDRCAMARADGYALPVGEAVAYARRGRGSRVRASAGWASLTQAERRVVALVIAGLSNAEIGEKLFISTVTVKSHLTRVFSKLGLSTRRELIRAAAQLGYPIGRESSDGTAMLT